MIAENWVRKDEVGRLRELQAIRLKERAGCAEEADAEALPEFRPRHPGAAPPEERDHRGPR